MMQRYGIRWWDESQQSSGGEFDFVQFIRLYLLSCCSMAFDMSGELAWQANMHNKSNGFVSEGRWHGVFIHFILARLSP